MVHKNASTGTKAKPRGRPFPKGNKRGKLADNVLASSRCESSHEGGIIAPIDQLIIDETINHQKQEIVKEQMSTEQEQLNSIPSNQTPENELVESIDFINGQNVLTIRFMKKHNRMFRIQIFLNNQIEIRPVTYTGSSTAYTFWDLLKNALKK